MAPWTAPGPGICPAFLIASDAFHRSPFAMERLLLGLEFPHMGSGLAVLVAFDERMKEGDFNDEPSFRPRHFKAGKMIGRVNPAGLKISGMTGHLRHAKRRTGGNQQRRQFSHG